MNWKNVDLKNSYELDQNIIDPLSFKKLLLEISCNIRKEDLTKESILKQFETDLKSIVTSAREVMRDNLDNILKEAQDDRKEEDEDDTKPNPEEWKAIFKSMGDNEDQPQEIDVKFSTYLIDYFTEVLPPITFSKKHVLCSEPYNHTNEGAGIFAGFFMKNDKFFGVYTTKAKFLKLLIK